MTSIRFVGDVPLWLGLVLAAIVAILSWLYYKRENFNLPRRLKIILPLLRSTAFALGILILTGPVLHHRKTVGELGKVKLFIDGSQSMDQRDKHMSLIRKLQIAKQLGWLTGEVPSSPQLSLIDQLTDQREKVRRIIERQEEVDQPDDLKQTVENFLSFLKTVELTNKELGDRLQQQVIEPLRSVMTSSPQDIGIERLKRILRACQDLERESLEKLESELELKIGSGNESIATAIDLFDETPRWRRIAMMLDDETSSGETAALLDTLRSRHDVEVYVIDRSTVATTRIEPEQELPMEEMADSDRFAEATDLGNSISSRLKGPGTETPNEANSKTAVVLLSDGQHNSGPSPILTARYLANEGYSFFNIAVGAQRPAVDLAVIKLEYPKTVFQKDQVRGSMIIRDTMTSGKPFVAQVRYDDKVLWQEQITSRNIGERRIDFQFTVDQLLDDLKTGNAELKRHLEQLDLRASITPLPEETEPNNNSQAMRLSVITEGYKLLILDGRSRWETRFIRNAFERDPQWEVRTIIAGKSTSHPSLPRGNQPGQFPTSKTDLFDYDLIMWGELDLELMDARELDWIEEFVEIRGGGILFIDGLRGKLKQLANTSLSGLLPVLNYKPPLTQVPDALELAPQGAELPALVLANDKQENQQFWTKLPPPRTLVPIEPTADSVVLVHAKMGEETLPAIVNKSYGAGKVIYLAFDESWRWRYKSADLWHQRAWHQLAKFAMPQPYSVSDEFVSIDSGPASYESGEKPTIRVRLKGLDGKPNSEAVVDALLWKNGKVVSTVNLVADQLVPGVYRSKLDELAAGDYEISIRASGYQDSALPARSRFLVLPSESGESSETAANVQLLQQMASISDGQLLREEEIEKLPELLDPLSNGRVVESETLLWQSYWLFSVMLILLTAEWILRKRAGLL